MALLSERGRARALPEGSLGREYLRFMEHGKLTADGLTEAQTMGSNPNDEFDDDRRYVADRIRDMHDLWHVLTDYGCDDTGEIANLWFSVGQFGNPGMAFIAFFGTLDGQMDRSLVVATVLLARIFQGAAAPRASCASPSKTCSRSRSTKPEVDCASASRRRCTPKGSVTVIVATASSAPSQRRWGNRSLCDSRS